MKIDEMFDRVHAAMSEELASGLPVATPKYWLVIVDAVGQTCSRIDPPEDAETQPMRDAYESDPDIEGIATVSFVRPHGAPQLLASVIVRHFENSDIRRARLSGREDGTVEVGPWEYTV